MRQFDIPQIEADAVIVLTHHDDALGGEVIPFWECTLTTQELHQVAARSALQLAEAIGGGTVQYQIHDFRKTEQA